jgi:hypothetical protein
MQHRARLLRDRRPTVHVLIREQAMAQEFTVANFRHVADGLQEGQFNVGAQAGEGLRRS